MRDVWRQTRGHYDCHTVEPILFGDLNRSYTLLEQTSLEPRFSILDAGAGLRIPMARFSTRLAGLDLNAFPDLSYSTWISRDYDAVMRMGQPQFDEVEAHIFWPETGLVHRRYRRLLMPWLNSSGRRLLLSIASPLPLSL